MPIPLIVELTVVQPFFQPHAGKIHFHWGLMLILSPPLLCRRHIHRELYQHFVISPIDSFKKTQGSKEATSMEPHDEIEDLIKQLNSMSLEDPQVMWIIFPPPPRAGAGIAPDSKAPNLNGNPNNGAGRGFAQRRAPLCTLLSKSMYLMSKMSSK
ncbi:uncharacterized protein BJ212DRAFT_1304398 [Suillus subaureus]|uniref:Uncharacterized protein n=1 Tax=Suillus subaureus TaxID=48587 RepID=A0A9P7J5Z4_9AGAM|nr:uncharacterized protein BJ212DRAFT_1304398 [Suillus subaureus]KAG1804189.1 hypothetical protein BJ212DRAFT_1304398 [Suillus subaureus]